VRKSGKERTAWPIAKRKKNGRDLEKEKQIVHSFWKTRYWVRPSKLSKKTKSKYKTSTIAVEKRKRSAKRYLLDTQTA